MQLQLRILSLAVFVGLAFVMTVPASADKPIALEVVQDRDKAKPRVKLSARLQQQIDSFKRSIRRYQVVGKPTTLDKVMTLSLEDDQLKADMSGLPESNRSSRLQITDMPGTWVFSNRKLGNRLYRNLISYDFDAAAGDGFWQVAIYQHSGSSLNINARGGETSGIYSISFSQYGGGVRLSVTSMKNGMPAPPNISVAAKSLGEFVRNEQELTRKYLRPLFGALGLGGVMRPDAADVYQLFKDIPADEAVTRTLRENLLPRLDDADFVVRETAMDELMNLGRPGTLAALRLDHSKLTVEQQNRLGLLISAYTTLKLKDFDESRRDLDVLIDCLADEDTRVREAALAAIIRVSGKQVDFNVSLDEKTAIRAAERLRRQLTRKEK